MRAARVPRLGGRVHLDTQLAADDGVQYLRCPLVELGAGGGVVAEIGRVT
jgi:hypothetical protein